jgi:uncharacterized protein with FMN-binding domain
MSSNIKPLVALGLTAVGAALVVNFKVAEPTTVAAVPTSTTSSAGSTTTQATASQTSSAQATTAPTTSTSTSASSGSSSSSSSASYADGSYTGTAVNEPWGTFQVQVTVSGGQVTAVTLVSAPTDRHSSSINSYAVPQLTQEALAAQSAQIDMVSGATWTSQSYITSLQAALDDAAAAQQQTAG